MQSLVLSSNPTSIPDQNAEFIQEITFINYAWNTIIKLPYADVRMLLSGI